MLPSSDEHDSITCSALGDVTFDGQKELILGTYGKVRPSKYSKMSYLVFGFNVPINIATVVEGGFRFKI